MIEAVKLTNSKGMELHACNYGATLMALKVPNRRNELVNVVVGLETANDYIGPKYQEQDLYLGSTVGRYAGRISNGSFELDGKAYSLDSENGVHLHGGNSGFDKKYWDIISVKQNRNPCVGFRLVSEDMEGGYPGRVEVTVEYELLESNALRIVHTATTDRPTILNLTNHAYYNLDGEGSISEHYLQINSSKMLELDERKVPTGKILECSRTYYDFIQKAQVKKVHASGLDNVYLLSHKPLSASLFSKKSGICMKVFSKQLAVVIYTPLNFPDLNFRDKAFYSLYPAICFETQNYPDAPNNPHFPSSVLHPGETYTNEAVFDFSTVMV